MEYKVIEGGGITSPKGFTAGAVYVGVKSRKSQKPDVAVLYSETEASCAAVFTTNKFCAAPVILDREILKNGKARSDMSAISMAISQYHFEMKAYPKTLNDLTKKSDDGQYGPWIRRIEQDPWGHAYSYTTVTDGANGEYYLLVSGGADGAVQTTKLPSDTEKSNNDDIVVVSK